MEILLEVGFNKGVPINEAFYNAHISGRHNPDITSDLFPDWSEERREQFADDKEARFRALAGDASLILLTEHFGAVFRELCAVLLPFCWHRGLPVKWT